MSVSAPPRQIRITFGAMAAPIAQQTGLSKRRCAVVQRLADAITLLVVQGAISDATAHRARAHVLRRIAKLHGVAK